MNGEKNVRDLNCKCHIITLSAVVTPLNLFTCPFIRAIHIKAKILLAQRPYPRSGTHVFSTIFSRFFIFPLFLFKKNKNKKIRMTAERKRKLSLEMILNPVLPRFINVLMKFAFIDSYSSRLLMKM